MATYYIEKEFDLETFEAWGGAVSRLEEIKDLGVIEQAQEHIEDVLYFDWRAVTATDINDMLWFDMDDFIQCFEEDEEEEEEE